MKRLFSAVLAIVFLLGGSVRAELFKDGETVCFLGDSITHGRQYHSMIYAYYLTRFPDCTIHFVNAGIAGDSAGGALGRLDDDVISKSPSTVVVMLGMNDVGRGNYVSNPTEKQLAAQQAALDRYRANMDKLLGRLSRETSARFVVLTPSPFDQTSVSQRDNNQPGCNDGLEKCAGIVCQLASKYQAEVIDLHGPMTAFNLQQQKSDPTYTLIGPDRVHPGPPGNLMMAWLFLKAQGAPVLVSRVEFDATAGRVVESANATVSDVQRKGAGWKFTVHEKALPYPVDAQAREILDAIPLEKELNQEVVQIKELAKGSHVLSIDGERVACHTAAEWSDGVNLAVNEAAPQAKQALKVAEINEKRRRTEVRLRGYACVRWFLRHRHVDPDDFAAVKKYAETKMAKTGYYESQVPTYLEEWERRDEIVAQVAALEQEALCARIPVPHEYEIRPER
ncbi:MAG: SGNH/GDSL hydrolase family protein [Planctomycetes bacterium]|nr:SGNH/GDSL hydrolase family protein [Planctomycetota bacterium]